MSDTSMVRDLRIAAALTAEPGDSSLLADAADEIDRLRAELAEARRETAAECGEPEGASGLTGDWRCVSRDLWVLHPSDRHTVQVQRTVDGRWIWHLSDEEREVTVAACAWPPPHGAPRDAMRAAEAAAREAGLLGDEGAA